MTPPAALISLLKPWADFYGDSKAAETIVTFLHIGGLVLGGGFAISADRATIRALRLPAGEREPHLRELASIHGWVLAGLGLVVVSGVALVTADIETFWSSWIYWTKMALVVLLLVNGWVMTRAEQALARDAGESSRGWRTLHRVAVNSLTLWFVITGVGVALLNYS